MRQIEEDKTVQNDLETEVQCAERKAADVDIINMARRFSAPTIIYEAYLLRGCIGWGE